MSVERLFYVLAWGYPMLAANALLWAIIIGIAYKNEHKPHLLSAMIVMGAGTVLFTYRSVTAFGLPYSEELFIGRILVTILAIATTAHTLIGGFEEYERRRQAGKDQETRRTDRRTED